MMWLSFALLLFIFQMATILFAEFRRPSKGIAWLFILFMFPLIGFLMYYFLAQDYRQRSKVRRRGLALQGQAQRWSLPQGNVLGTEDLLVDPLLQSQKRLIGLLQSFPDANITGHNDVLLMSSAAEAYERMLREIELAQHHVHLLYYIWNDDEIGRTYQQLLMRKAREGVEIRIIHDGIGTYTTSNAFWDELRAAGAQVHCFLPVFIAFFDKRINYRNHRKITVIDGKIGYIGGANIGDEYLGKNKKLGFWRDTCVRLQGDSVYELQRSFLRDWQFVSGQQSGDIPKLFPAHAVTTTGRVQIVPSGPDTDWDSILEMFFAAFVSAKERIYITTPYFIPDRSILMALVTAALSGVDVRIVIPGVADSRIPMWASLSYIEEMLQAGIRVYRYNKGFMHAKTVVVDQHFASIGTANLDLRSFYSNFEINAAFLDKEVVNRLAGDIVQDVGDSSELMLSTFITRPRLRKVQEAIGHLFAPLL
jgi:cardiolipin synthase